MKVVGLFLVAFVIAIFLAITTVSSPQLSESKCQAELKELQLSLEFQREIFTPHVNNIKVMLSKITTYGAQGGNLKVLNNDIGAVLSEIKGDIKGMESPDTALYQNVVQALSDLQIAYNKQLDLGETAEGLIEIRTELQLCTAEKRQLENEIRNLEASASKGSDCSNYIKQLTEAEKSLSICKKENRALSTEIDKLRNQ